MTKGILVCLGLTLTWGAGAQTYPALWVKPVIQSIQSTIALTTDGGTIVTGGEVVRVLRAPQITQNLAVPSAVYNACAGITGDGLLVAISPATATGAIHVVRSSDGTIVNTLDGLAFAATSLKFSPDNRYLAAIVTNLRVLVWRLSDNVLVRAFEVAGLLDAEWLPDSRSLLTIQGNDRVEQREVTTGATVRSYVMPGRTLKCLDLNLSGTRFAVSDANDTFVTDTASGESSHVVQEFHSQLAISDDGDTLCLNSSGVWAFDVPSRNRLWNATIATPGQLKFAANKLVAKNSQLWILDSETGRVIGSSARFQDDWGYVGRGERFCSTSTSVFRTLDGLTMSTVGGTVSPDGSKVMTIGFWPALHDVSTGSQLWVGRQRLDISTSGWTLDSQFVIPGIGVETQPKDLFWYHTNTGFLMGKLPPGIVRFSPDDSRYLHSSTTSRLVTYPQNEVLWESPEAFGPLRFVRATNMILGRQNNSIVRLDSRNGALVSKTPMEFNSSFVFGADGEVFAQDAGPYQGRFIRFFRLYDGAVLREIHPPVSAFNIRAVGDEAGQLIWIVCTSGGALLKNPYFMEGNSPTDSVSVEKGRLITGDMASLAQPDNDRFVVSSDGDGKIVLLLEGASALSVPGTLFSRLVATASVLGIRSDVELFDYSSGQYSSSEKRQGAVPKGEDLLLNVVPLDSANFVSPSGRVRARVTFTPTQPVLRNWTVSIDQFAWQASP